MKINNKFITLLIIASTYISGCTSSTVTTGQVNPSGNKPATSTANVNVTNSLSTLPNLVISDQPIDNEINVASLNLDKPGYVIVKNEVNGAPGEVIGISKLLAAGTHNDIKVNVDNTKLAVNSYVVLYYESNNNSSFDINKDEVVTINKTQISMPIVSKTSTFVPRSFLPNLIVQNQFLSDNNLKIVSINIDKPGYVVIQQDLNGLVGPVIGHSALLEGGTYNNLDINIDGTMAVNMVHATIHYDDNNNRTFDYPQADQPIKIADKTFTMTIKNVAE